MVKRDGESETVLCKFCQIPIGEILRLHQGKPICGDCSRALTEGKTLRLFFKDT